MTGAIMMLVGGRSVSPTVTGNWADISGNDFASNSDIAATGTASLRITASSVTGTGALTVEPAIAGVPFGASLTMSNGSTLNFSVSVGQLLHFDATIVGSSGASKSGTVTITNQSLGGTTIDTFTVGMTVS